MSAKAEIGWKSVTPEGEKREVYAQHVSREWRFFARVRRYDHWEPLKEPPLDDWLELLDAVRRRIQRRLLPPDEEVRVRKRILEQFPDADI